MISICTSTLESRGGRHGETHSASHDEKKDQQKGDPKAVAEINEVQDAWCPQGVQAVEERQIQQSIQDIAEKHEKEGGFGMTSEPSNLPKTGGQVARVLGNLTNDPRVTNVLLVLIALIGMGGAEAVQSQICSL